MTPREQQLDTRKKGPASVRYYIVSISKEHGKFRPVYPYTNLDEAKNDCESRYSDPLVTGGHVIDCQTRQKVYTVGDQSPEDAVDNPCVWLEG